MGRPQITSPTGGAHHWLGADDHGRTTEEPRAWQACTRRADAEVDGAIAPSAVTNSGLLRASVDKQSIYYTASASLLPPVSPTPVPTCSLAIEVSDDRMWVYSQRFARYPCPRRRSSPRSPRLSRAPRRLVSSEKEPPMALGITIPHGYCT